MGVSRNPAVGRLASRLPLRREPRLVERWSWAMGQAVHLTLFADTEDRGYEAASAVTGELLRLDQRLSAFDATSDLAELNRCAGRRAVRVGHDALSVLRAAERFRVASGGGFNAAVEPLMRAWGFHHVRAHRPSVAEIAEARDAVRSARVELDGAVVRLPAAHTRLDFGGIAVGYALDRAGAILRSRGIDCALLNISGDCLAVGAPPGRAAWTIEIVDSERPTRIVGSALLRDAALATSANTISVRRYAAFRAGHIMDPATGWPAGAVRQVTVVARTGIEADALSTALLVLGRGRRLPGVVRSYVA